MIQHALSRSDPQAMGRWLLREAHQRDGLPEILVGVVFLTTSVSAYLSATLPRGSAGLVGATVGMAFGVPILMLAGPRAIEWLRARYLLRRYGYVKHAKPAAPGIVTRIVVVAAILVIAAIALTSGGAPGRWLLVGTAVGGAALLAVAGGTPRYWIAGMAFLTLGVMLALLGLPFFASLALLFGLSGAAAVVSGLVRFARFLRATGEHGQSEGLR